jgi:ABC-type transport system substrate-binding protein
MTWIEYFITNTDSICSNYESQEMETLYRSAMEETDPAQRFEIYQRIQELWARDFPTLDLTQEPRVAVSLPNVQDFIIDAIGLLHYDLLTKSGG